MTQSAKATMDPGEEWFQVALRSIGDAVIATDIEGLITFLNPAAESLTGWTRSEASGVSLDLVFQIVNEDTRRTVESPALRALREGVIVGLANHTLLISKDGSEYPIDDSAAPIRRASGEIVGVVLVFRDVTQRRDDERALVESEQRFRLLVEGVQDYAIFMLDPLGNITSWNAGAERIKGYKATEIIGKHFSCFYPPNVVAQGIPDMELKIAADTGRFEDEGWRLRKDGSRFWANLVITAVRDNNSVLKGFSKITRDLTERKMAEEELRAREERLQALTQAATEAIISADQDGNIASWNKAASLTFGYTESEALGQPVTLLVPENYLDAHRKGFTRYRATRSSRLIGKTVELEGRKKNGQSFPIELSLTTWKTDEGRFFTAIVRDITLRKQDAEKLREMTQMQMRAESLADLNRRKDAFLAMLSHELRNPLSPIINAVQLLRSARNDQQTSGEAVNIIERQAEILRKLVDDLLEVSRISTGRIRLDKEVVDLRDVINRAIEATKSEIDGKSHELSTSFPEGAVWVDADPVRLEQAVINLLKNAAKYTPDQGKIRLTLERENEAVLHIIDTGVGIGPALLPVVFDLFTQAEQSLDRSQGGLGIGLSVVQRVVELHGGKVEASSEGSGSGSTFTVHLPLATPPTNERFQDGSDANVNSALRVLVVDDNKDAADSTAALLRQAGHQVEVCYSGSSVLVAAREFQPEAVLLDIGLPVVDGVEVARRLRENEELKDARLIALTGYTPETDRTRINEAGFDSYLIKPVDLQKIENALAVTALHKSS